jgi:hypothetical protein
VNLVGSGLDFLAFATSSRTRRRRFFGLDHSHLRDALMYAQSESSDFIAPPSLDPDDAYAICADYPTTAWSARATSSRNAAFRPCAAATSDGCASRHACRPARRPAWMLALLAASALVLRKRNARRLAR